jgi:hypothetical protein
MIAQKPIFTLGYEVMKVFRVSRLHICSVRTFLCVVSPRFPENYHIGVQSKTWGVERRYKNRISQAHVGDELVFMAGQQIRSIHRIESEVYEDDQVLWPPKDGDCFPFRIKISEPLTSARFQKRCLRKRSAS